MPFVAETFDADHLAAELLGDEAVLHQALAHELRVRVRAGRTLLTATTIGTSAALRVVDRLDRLRHDAFGRRDDEHTMSVTCAPRARIAVKAAWPGVSMNVITRVADAAPGRRRCAA